jgi:ferredoxin-type protein NapF
MTTIDTARRAFFRGSAVPAAHHVPWAIEAFETVCNRCGDCINACEEAVLVKGDGGFPTADLRLGACTFCAACVEACRPGALSLGVSPAWRITPQFGDACLSRHGVTCRSCGDACEQRAIRFTLRVGGCADPVVDQRRCTGCGACTAICPNQSIHMKEER